MSLTFDDIENDVALAPDLPTPEQMPKLRYTVGKIHGWLEVGQYYTCVPDAVYPWDPGIMKAIWQFAPDATPLWIQWVFLTPPEEGQNEIKVFGRHALGRRIRHPRTPLPEFRCVMPTMPCQGLTFEKPNSIWFAHTGNDSPISRDLPGNYLGFNDTILDRARRSAVGFNMTDKEYTEHLIDEIIGARLRRLQAVHKTFEEEEEYAERELERYWQKIKSNVSDVELEEYVKSAGHRERVKKPTVFLGSGLPAVGGQR